MKNTDKKLTWQEFMACKLWEPKNGIEYVSGSNYFNEKDFLNACSKLEEGKAIKIGIDCIGFTRADIEGNQYYKHLKAKYGDKLIVRCEWANEYYREWAYILRQ